MPIYQRLSTPFSISNATNYVAARQHLNNKSFTRIDSCKLFYMDVGVWGGGPDGRAKSTFGLVCGNDVLLCSWLNVVEGGRDPSPDYVQLSPEGKFDLSAGSRRFLQSSRQIHRGFVVYNARSDEPLTDPGQPVIVIPDLHLHLYKGELIDRFQFKPIPPFAAGKFKDSAAKAGLTERRDALKPYYIDQPPQPLVSLDEELADMIEVAKHCSADIVQLGDLYEVWEAEILLRTQYLEMLRARDDLARNRISLRHDEERMLITKKVVPRHLQMSFSHYAAYVRELPDQIVTQCGADFTHNGTICDAIRKTHPVLFQGSDGTDLFKYQIDGNHDNQLMNFYWIEAAPSEFRNNEVLGDGTISGKRHPEIVSQQIGTAEHRIHIEHGHRYDWHNNDKNWSKDGAGFDTVFDFLLRWKSFAAGVAEGRPLSGTLFTGGQKGREFADWWADLHAYDMRKPGCRAADEAFGTSPAKPSDSKVRLFIQGHTHDPQLWMIPVRCSLAEQLPGWRDYVLGKYWWGGKYPKHDQYLKEKKEEDAEFARTWSD